MDPGQIVLIAIGATLMIVALVCAFGPDSWWM